MDIVMYKKVSVKDGLPKESGFYFVFGNESSTSGKTYFYSDSSSWQHPWNKLVTHYLKPVEPSEHFTDEITPHEMFLAYSEWEKKSAHYNCDTQSFYAGIKAYCELMKERNKTKNNEEQ